MNLAKPKQIKPKPKKNKLVFLETYTVAPAPSRDYYGLKIFENKLIWLRWKISHGPSLRPLQNIVDLDDFLKDHTMQNEISYIFGSEVTKLINDVALKNWTLSTMPSSILDRIFIFMTVKDIWNLMQVCKRLYKECCKNELWEKLCKKRWRILIQSDVRRASSIGWKQVYKEKITQKYNKSDVRMFEKKLPHAKNKEVEIVKQKPPLPASKSNVSLIKKDKQKSEIIRSASAIYSNAKPLLKVSPLTRSIDRPISSPKEKSTPRKYKERIANSVYEGNDQLKSKDYLQVNEIKTKTLIKVENHIPNKKVTSIKARPQSKQSEKIKK